MNLIQVLVLAAVEGVTEFLPVSSTGHLILAVNAAGIMQSEFVKSFEIAIQLGAISAVVVLYWRKITTDMEVLKRVAAAFVPTGIAGILAYRFVKSYLLGNAGVTIAALLIGGAGLIVYEKFKIQNTGKASAARAKFKLNSNYKIQNLDYWKCIGIGLMQAVAMVPGVSRALMTIIGGEAMGLSRREAVEFSFMLAIPTMAAATGWDLVRSGWGFSGGQWGLLAAGVLAAAVTAAVTVKWLVAWVKQQHNLEIFGWYRIALAGGWWLFA